MPTKGGFSDSSIFAVVLFGAGVGVGDATATLNAARKIKRVRVFILKISSADRASQLNAGPVASACGADRLRIGRSSRRPSSGRAGRGRSFPGRRHPYSANRSDGFAGPEA